MDSTRSESISYTIERKFLAQISVTEFVSRVIQSHRESESMKKALENSCIHSKIYSREAVER